MAGPYTTPALAFTYKYDLGQTGWNTGYDADWLQLDALLQCTVKSKSTTAQPSSPTAGDRYIIPSGATGSSWASASVGQIAYWNGTTWQYFTPTVGTLVFVQDIIAFNYWTSSSTWSTTPAIPTTYASISVAGGSTVALTAAQALNGILNFTGALTANIVVTIPSGVPATYYVNNNTTGSYSLTFEPVGGSGITIPQGTINAVFCDGTNMYGPNYAQLSGATFTAPVYGTVFRAGTDTTSGAFTTDGPAGSNARGLHFSTASVARIQLSSDSTAETGSNTGCNFAIYCYSDTGSYLGSALTVTRSTQLVNFPTGYNGSLSITSGPVSVNNNATAAPSAITGSLIRVTQADSSSSNYEANAFANYCGISFRRYDGTNASPTAIQANDQISRIKSYGYDGTAVSSVQSEIIVAALDNWTTADHSTFMSFWNTNASSTSEVENMRLTGGHLLIGTTTDDGTHRLQVSGTASVTTPTAGDNSTSVATTAFATTMVDGYASISVAGGSTVTLTSTQAATSTINFTGALTANISVTVPASANKITVLNSTTGAYTLTLKTPSGTGVVLPQSSLAYDVYCDGTNVNWVATPYGALPTEVQNMPVATYHASTTSASEVVLVYSANQSLTLPANLAGTTMFANVAATSTPGFVIKTNHSGTITTVGTLTINSGGTVTLPTSSAVSLVSGDAITITGPSTPDSTLAQFSINLMLLRV